MSELKPCPFCGGEASIEYENYDFDGGNWWLIREADVVCRECGLVFHVENESREYQHGEHCLDFIIEAWNTRAERTCVVHRRGSSTDNRECSECGASYRGDVLYPLNYCPNCGAKVVEP